MSPAPPPPTRFHHVHRVAAIALAILGLSLGTGAVDAGEVPDYDFDWVVVGDPGNPPYPGSESAPFGIPYGYTALRGSVPYPYRISRLELTSAQWAAFLNAFNGLVLVEFLWTPGTTSTVGIDPDWDGPGIRYAPRTDLFGPGAADAPVLGVSHRVAMQYCNWLHNGKENSLEALETGAYDLTETRGEGVAGLHTVRRLPGARFWIPSVDEWLKAVHYDPDKHGPGRGGWWEYPYGSDEKPVPGSPQDGGETNAGLLDLSSSAPASPLFRVGLYPGSATPWGLLDASGGGRELIEDPSGGDDRSPRIHDGSSLVADFYQDGIDDRASVSWTDRNRDAAVRVASALRDTEPGDIDRDGRTDAFDLGFVISQWGECVEGVPRGLSLNLPHGNPITEFADIQGRYELTIQILEPSDSRLTAISLAGFEPLSVPVHVNVRIRDEYGRVVIERLETMEPGRVDVIIPIRGVRLRAGAMYTTYIVIDSEASRVSAAAYELISQPPFDLFFNRIRLVKYTSDSPQPAWPFATLWRVRGVPVCHADVNRDGAVTVQDLGQVLSSWTP